MNLATPPQGHLATSGNMSCCPDLGGGGEAIGICGQRLGVLLNIPKCTATRSPAQIINSANAERPAQRALTISEGSSNPWTSQGTHRGICVNTLPSRQCDRKEGGTAMAISLPLNGTLTSNLEMLKGSSGEPANWVLAPTAGQAEINVIC